MPRPNAPPTPASSTELKSQGKPQSTTLQMSFELPPPAVATTQSGLLDETHLQPQASTPSTMPSSEVAKVRRRSSATQITCKDSFALPPPPSRSRKIIQMKPRLNAKSDDRDEDTKSTPKAGGSAKSKQPSSSSAAGRKIARKTAHSLIERRRRSKMNEEFGVLKNMIPACTGEMHKLAILQASIDYIRYLEDCVDKLKAEHFRTTSANASSGFNLPPPPLGPTRGYDQSPTQSNGEDEDVEMANASPVQSKPAGRTHHPNLYSRGSSTNTSPVLGPGAYECARFTSSFLSPNIAPMRDMDHHEATAALLMLNADRRGTFGSDGGRGMSVKDLLSS